MLEALDPISLEKVSLWQLAFIIGAIVFGVYWNLKYRVKK